MSISLFVDELATPVGTLALVVDGDGRLRDAGWTEGHDRMERQLQRYGGVALVARANPFGITDALARYFAGELNVIDNIPVLADGTDFQRTVWSALREIPCGTTISYAELARRIGNPKAVRAVGLANGANPVGVVVPCHRVIGADGTLTGYGGGLARKQWLLRHEGATAAASPQLRLL